MPLKLGENQQDLLSLCTNEWRTFREIVWDFNGPRELCVPMQNLANAMRGLVAKRLVESRKIKPRYCYAGNNPAVEGTAIQYRLRRTNKNAARHH